LGDELDGGKVREMTVPLKAPAPYRFTRDDVRVMVDAGVLGRDARLELLDGELIQMPHEGLRHVTLKMLLTEHFIFALGRAWLVVTDSPLVLADDDVPEPDVFIVDRTSFADPVDVATVALVVEVSDSSLQHDLRRKSAKYAQYGVGEYWVVDLEGRTSTVFTEPRNGRYAFDRAFAFDEHITPARLPEAGVVIADLK
jgi:Uma2 family endonuclease